MHYSSAHQLMELLQRQEVTSAELWQLYQQRSVQIEPQVKGYLKRFEQPYQSTVSGPLAGLPIAIKDNICVMDYPTTCGSRILENFVPPYQATAIQRLLNQGLVLTGKSNMDEFGMGSSNENSAYHLTHNPWKLDCVPGGSSGGSAALVASGQVPWSLGSDTGGSVRLPAAFCGVVGLKPTYGLVSRYGLVAYASSLDQIGPITRDVRDNALLLNVLAGHDPMDSTSLSHSGEDYTRLLGQSVKGMRIGLPKEMLGEGVQPEVRSALNQAIETLQSLGAEVEEMSLPRADYALAAYYLIATSEASSNLARYDGVRYGLREKEAKNLEELYCQSRSQGFGDEVKRRIMLGTYALSSGYYEAYYKKAQQVRALLIEDFKQAFEKYDILLSPTSPVTAFKLGDKVSDPLSMYLIDILTVTVNLTGIPALSLPCGQVDGLPVGLQLMAKPLDEARLYQVAHAYEQATEWHTLKPDLE